MNAILDVLKLRYVKLNYISPPVCQLISNSGSGAGSISVEANDGPTTPTGLRFSGQCDSFLLWDSIANLTCMSLYKSQNPADPAGPYVLVTECAPPYTAAVCGPGWWTVTTTNNFGTEGAQSDPVLCSGTPIQIPIPRNPGDRSFALYCNPDPANVAAPYLQVLSSSTFGTFQVCELSGCYRLQAITDDGASGLSLAQCRIFSPGCCPPQPCSFGEVWYEELCACGPERFADILGPINSACVGNGYVSSLEALGATGPCTWTLISGAIPTGLTLQTGIVSGNFSQIAGTPSVTGSYTFTVRCEDAFQLVRTNTFTVVISGVDQYPTLPPATTDTPYSEQLTNAFGTGASTFSVVAGAFPAGLSMNSAGLITGTPSFLGSSTVEIQVVDSAGKICVTTFAAVVGGCPSVSTYPSIVYTPTTGDKLEDVMALDTTRRILWVQNNINPRPQNDSFDGISTITNSLVYEGPESNVPFGSCRLGYDPVNQLLAVVDRSGNWLRFLPGTQSFTVAGPCSTSIGADNVYKRLAVDTKRGHVLGDRHSSDSSYEIVRITPTIFSSLSSGAGVPGVTSEGVAYSDGADKFVVALRGNNPPLFYIDPVSYAVTVSTINEVEGGLTPGGIYSLPGTPWVMFARSDNHLVFVDASTDTEYWVTPDTVPGSALTDATYDSCSGVMYVATNIGVYKWNVLTKSSRTLGPIVSYRTLEFDSAANRVYGLIAFGGPNTFQIDTM